MELKIPIKEGTGTKTMLKILNPFINNLTAVELDIVATMVDKGFKELSTDNRSALRTSLNMNKYLFNNYIKYLKDKKILYLNNKVLTLNPKIAHLTADKKITIELYARSTD